MNEYKVTVSNRAKLMLGEHLRFLAQSDKIAAKKTEKRFLESFRSLKILPERYPFIEDECIESCKYRKMFVEKWYLVIYSISDSDVHIDYILDCRQDYSWLLK